MTRGRRPERVRMERLARRIYGQDRVVIGPATHWVWPTGPRYGYGACTPEGDVEYLGRNMAEATKTLQGMVP